MTYISHVWPKLPYTMFRNYIKSKMFHNYIKFKILSVYTLADRYITFLSHIWVWQFCRE